MLQQQVMFALIHLRFYPMLIENLYRRAEFLNFLAHLSIIQTCSYIICFSKVIHYFIEIEG